MPDPALSFSVLKIPYEGLFRWDNNGVFRGAHHQFREVVVKADNTVVSEKLLPATPWGTDPDFPVPDLISLVLNDALAENSLRAAGQSAAELVRDAAIAERDAAIAERDAALAERDAALAERAAALAERAAAAASADEAIAELQARINELTAVPERPEGKWWKYSAAFLEEFTPEETLAISRSDVPLISKLLMMLLAWPGEIWAADERIQDGLQALVSLDVLTEARRQAILT
jgi:multidrug efflux pump subunit AcrA (membrane-fusion protein)